MFYQYKNEVLHYDIVGSGKKILILHGLGCNLNMMKACMEPIFEKIRIKSNIEYQRIYLDLPGMGKSTCDIELASSDYILDILNQFVKEIVQGDFLLVGESYGGYLARGILFDNIETVEGLMLLCPVIVPKRTQRDLPVKNVYIKDETFIETLSEKEQNEFCEFAVVATEFSYNRYKAEVLDGMKDVEERFIFNLKNKYEFSSDIDAKIRSKLFAKPSLFIAGRQDICVGYKDLLKLIEDYPKATVTVLDMAGHNLQLILY